MASRKVPVSCCARTLTRGVSGSRAEAGSTTILAEVAGALGRRNDPGSLSFFLPLFTRVRGGGILRTSCLRSSRKFSSENSHLGYKDNLFGGCAVPCNPSYLTPLCNVSGLTSPAPL